MQKSKISMNEWSEIFVGYTTKGCGLRAQGMYYLLLEELPVADPKASGRQTTKGENRIAIFFEDEAPKAWSHEKLSGFSSPRLAIAQKPKPQAVVMGGSSVYYLGGGEGGVEPKTIPLGGCRPRTVGGKLFAVGGYRTVAERLSTGNWQKIGQGLPELSAGINNEVGFKDISGFTENDMYAVGGKGDVWHWNGSQWHQCDFPSNYFIETVLCAGDGKVYITGQTGSIFVGRDDKWKMLEDDALSGYYNDTVWYDGKVWLSHDSGLYVLNADGVAESADLPSEIHVTTGHLSVGDGLMLSAGIGGASVYDGKKWEILVNHFEMQKLAGGGKGKKR